MELTIPVPFVLRSAKVIGVLAYAIALAGVAGSYGTQVELLRAHGLTWFAWVVPVTVDLLAVCAAMALQLPGLDRGSRKIAGWTLTISVIVSVAANVTGAHDWIAAAAHAWPVLAYLLGELLANRVRAFAARVVAAQAAAQQEQAATPELKASDAEAEDLPAAPVSPAPAGTASATADSVAQPAPAARKGRPRRPVERDPETGAVVRKDTGERVPRTTERRILTAQPERLMAD